ncbi:MAG: M16 family metallopeptidase [Limisphaerales bacterium]
MIRPEPGPAYELVTLRNGLRLATAFMPHMASVSVGLWVRVGGRYESEELNGVSHFIEHLLFKGTRRRTAAEISQAVEGIGGYLNAWTSEEGTCFYARAAHDRFEELFEVLQDMLLNSKFSPLEIEKERGVIQEEVSMYLDQPHQYVQELLNAIQWTGHPLGRPVTGTAKSVARLTRRHLVGFLRQNYTAPNLLVTVAGNFDPSIVRRAAERMARRCPSGPPTAFAQVESFRKGPSVRLRRRSIDQTQLALGIRTCSRHDDRRFALRLLNALLGENMSSRLFQRVREEKGLAYSIYSSPSFFDDVGDLVISAGLDEAKLRPVLGLVIEEIRRLRRAPPPPGELKRARDYLVGQMELSLESTESQMTWLGEQLQGYGRIIPPGQIKDALHRVGGADIRAVAADFLDPTRFHLALVGPVSRVDDLPALLRRAAD